jgi:hypothetical protein
MRKVITNIETPIQYTLIKNVSVDKFYGTKIDSFVGFITRYKYQEREYTIRVASSFTKGNGYDQFDHKNLDQTIANIIIQGHPVYEFDTFCELMEWVIKECNNE